MTAISPAELVNLLRDETYTDWKLEAEAADLIEQQADQIAAARDGRSVTEQEIIDRFGSLNSATVMRIVREGERIVTERMEDGVFE